MIKKLLKTTLSLVSLMMLLAFGALAIWMANIEILDLDLWLHLGAGRYIWRHGTIPGTDIFSATLAGRPWINHEWLFQVVAVLAYRLAGPDGLIALRVIIVGLLFTLLWFGGYRRDTPVWTVILLLLVLFVLDVRMTLRPDLFSLLFLTLYLLVLRMDRLSSRKGVLFLGICQVLWTNTHGFFILGPLIILAHLLGEWSRRRLPLPWKRSDARGFSDEGYTRLKIAFGLTLGATLVNPRFLQGAFYPFNVMATLSGQSKMFLHYVGELRPPITWPTLLAHDRFFAFKILILLSASTLWVNRRRLDLSLVLLWILFLFMALNAMRNVVFFAVIAYFVILANTPPLCSFKILRRLGDRHGVRFLLISLLINLCVTGWIIRQIQARARYGYFNWDRYTYKSDYGGISLINYPHKAVDFLLAAGIQGRFFNDFNSGAYLIGRTAPAIKVFVDGRTEFYGPGYMQQQDKIWKGDTRLFEEVVQKYHLTGVFAGSARAPAPEAFLRYLAASPSWVLVYFDHDAAIFLKDIPANQPWIHRYAVDLSQWRVPSIDLIRLGLRNPLPDQHIRRAYGLYAMGYLDQAEQELREVRKAYPRGNAKVYYLLGKIAVQRKQNRLAFENFRKAWILKPLPKIRQDLDKAFARLQAG